MAIREIVFYTDGTGATFKGAINTGSKRLEILCEAIRFIYGDGKGKYVRTSRPSRDSISDKGKEK